MIAWSSRCSRMQSKQLRRTFQRGIFIYYLPIDNCKVVEQWKQRTQEFRGRAATFEPPNPHTLHAQLQTSILIPKRKGSAIRIIHILGSCQQFCTQYSIVNTIHPNPSNPNCWAFTLHSNAISIHPDQCFQ